MTKIKIDDEKAEKQEVEADNYLIISVTEDGGFSLTHNNLKVQEILGMLELAGYQIKQDFKRKNYKTAMFSLPKKV